MTTGPVRGASRIAVVCVFFLLVLCVLGLAVNRSSLRSDGALESHFFAHRAEFERLVAMATEDVHLTRIAPTFTWLDDNVSWPRKNVGISEQRWNEYKRLFRRAGVRDGVLKGTDPARILFPIVSEGLVPSGYTKGVVYSAEPLNPVLKSLDERPPDKLWNGSHVLVYKPIEDHWYIYFEQW